MHTLTLMDSNACSFRSTNIDKQEENIVSQMFPGLDALSLSIHCVRFRSAEGAEV